MSVLNIAPLNFGVVGVSPTQYMIWTDNTLAEVTANGYLNYSMNFALYNFSNKDFAWVTTTDSGTQPCQFSVTNGVIDLSVYSIASVTLVGDPTNGLSVTQAPVGTWTIDLDQNLSATGFPTFSNLNLTSLGGFSNATKSIVLANTTNGTLSIFTPSASTPRYLSNDVSGDLKWDTVNLAGTGVSGTLPIVRGGTNSATALTNGILMSSAAGSIVEVGANVSANSFKITNLADPTQPADAVTKSYADNLLYNFTVKAQCDLATTAALPACTYNNGAGGVGATLVANAVGALTVDSVAGVAGYRVLVKNQVTTAQNGIYVMTTPGTAGTQFILTRASDFNSGTNINIGDTTYISAGTVNTGSTWASTTEVATVGTDPILFYQVGGASALTIVGTTNQIEANLVGSTYTLSLPQDIEVDSGVTFGSVTAVSVGAAEAFIQSISHLAQSPTTGGIMRVINDGGSALLSGNSLGTYNFGALRAVNFYNFSSLIRSLATENWSSTAAGSKLDFYTTPNTTLTPVLALSINQNAVATFTANPIMSGLTASQAVVTDGSKALSSLAYTPAATNSTLVSRNAQGLSLFNAIGFLITVTTGSGTFTLTSASTGIQQFTSSSATTIVMPDATTLTVNRQFKFIYTGSGGTPVIKANDTTTTLGTMTPFTSGVLILTDNSTTNGTWIVDGWTANTSLSPISSVTTFGSTPNANGLSTSASRFILMQPASASFPGGVSTTTQSFAGVKTFTNGAVTLGLAAGAAPATGNIGEVLSASLAVGSAVSLTTATVTDVTSLAYTAGNWLVIANATFSGSGITATELQSFVGTASGTSTTGQTTFNTSYGTPFGVGVSAQDTTPVNYYFTTASSGTLYLKAKGTFSVGTCTAYGGLTMIRVS